MKTRTAEADCSIVTPTMPHNNTPSGMIPNSSSKLTSTETMTNGTTPTTTNRRRALSLAEPQPSVETVVVKAKRAAQSLWMLLHAQSCTLGQRCPHTGCQEAKLLHLHLKTCSNTNNGECPMMYHGCDQSRKLLAHYRRCRTLRARLATGANTNGGKQQSSLSHHCLVCSLVARQARTMLEQRTSPPPTTTTNGMNVFKSSSTNAKRSSSVTRQKMSYTLLSTSTTNDNHASILNGRNGYNSNNNHINSSSPAAALKMPPPPPRVPPTTNNTNIDSLARLYATAKQMDIVSASDHNNNDIDIDNLPHSNIHPVVRRERSVSDTELFHYKTTAASMTVNPSKHFDCSADATSMMMVDDDEEEEDNDFNNFGSNRQQQRLRSASCGTGVTTTNYSNAAVVVSLSPSHHYCETIVEEES